MAMVGISRVGIGLDGQGNAMVAGLPMYDPMRSCPPGTHTAGYWRTLGRRVPKGTSPDGYAWRAPGCYRGHYYGGWYPIFGAAKTLGIGERAARVVKAPKKLEEAPAGVPDLSDFIAVELPR